MIDTKAMKVLSEKGAAPAAPLIGFYGS